jgi:SAM-dependent methyltransferase
MKSGIVRAPVYPFTPEGIPESAIEQSSVTFDMLMDHNERAELGLGLHGSNPYRATAADLAVRRERLEMGKDQSYALRRGIQAVGVLVTGTVSQMEAEFAGKQVLDIGSGEAKLGTELARKAKARVTFLDNNSELLGKIPRKVGKRVLADGVELPFADESFDKTVSAFSSIIWSPHPLESLKSLHEAIRVTRIGGTTFAVPIVVNPEGRKLQETSKILSAALNIPEGQHIEPQENLKVWLLQDHLLLHSLLELSKEGYCSVTWTSFIGSGVNTGVEIEQYSAVIDKDKPVPHEVLTEHMAYADRFIAAD